MVPSLTVGDLLLSRLDWFMSEAVKSRACWMIKDVSLKMDLNPDPILEESQEHLEYFWIQTSINRI
uniref:Aquarius intron-binding spliceosomal factor n=1 Tax=Rousettus aegyptiacus TaxID=9407 RepID=A0A7J8IEN8_ROUAE|nr:aquarius intron-binding spliceosomal factor [Rousettus aegyptiacus]